MEVKLLLNKSVDENAALYFEESKKAKRKIEGIKKAITNAQKNLKGLEKDEPVAVEKKKQRKKDWYESFRWSFTSSGKLIVGGRDATTNEIVIKKHTAKDDQVFHTDSPGSPFVVLKTEGRKVEPLDIEEAAIITGSFSKAWKLGLTSAEVYHVFPEQVSKTVKAGEYMGKGSFMIYGKRNYVRPVLKLSLAHIDGRIECGATSSIRKRAERYVEIVQGSEKASSLAKKIKKIIGGELDDIIRVIPAGGCRLVKERK